jgi:hypothetical protein
MLTDENSDVKIIGAFRNLTLRKRKGAGLETVNDNINLNVVLVNCAIFI